jgi:membrane-associated phospholipid phosphatase
LVLGSKKFNQMKRFHEIISLIFQPLLMPTYAMAMLINTDIFSVQPSKWQLVAMIGTFLFTGILPAVPIFLLIRKGEVQDLFMSKREERTMPYLFSFLAYVFWAVFLWRTLRFDYLGCTFIVAMAMGSALSIGIITFINLRWKISAHTSGMGGITAAVFGVCYRMGINPIWILMLALVVSAVVALARIELKAHTPAQALAGFVLGFLLVFLPAIFF